MTAAPIVSSDLVETEALLREANAPAFAEPWMAHAFACAVQLSRRGLFTWSEWVEAFSTEIKAHPAQPGETSNAAYHRQWLAALETIVGLKGAASTAEIMSARRPGAKPISTRHMVSRSNCATPRRRLRLQRITTITTASQNQSRSAPRYIILLSSALLRARRRDYCQTAALHIPFPKWVKRCRNTTSA